MNIRVTWGTGESSTRKAAFDAALRDAGISKYNLIPLSSVIPPGSEIHVAKLDLDRNGGDYGHRLYVVISVYYQESRGKNAVAGIGWVAEKSDGRGIFMEASGETEESVRDEIGRSLDAMKAARTGKYGGTGMKLASCECSGGVSCAVVAAVYKSEGWE